MQVMKGLIFLMKNLHDYYPYIDHQKQWNEQPFIFFLSSQDSKMDNVLKYIYIYIQKDGVSQRGLRKGLYSSPDTFLEIDRHKLDRPSLSSSSHDGQIDICASLRAARVSRGDVW